MSEGGDTGKRARLLPAYVEIMAAVDDLQAAERGCAELDSIAQAEESPEFAAGCACARPGRARRGRPQASLAASLRRADELWRRFAAPYESARARELIGLACRRLGDEDSARPSWRPPGDLRPSWRGHRSRPDRGLDRAVGAHDLTKRELEVLRRLSAGERPTGRSPAAWSSASGRSTGT